MVVYVIDMYAIKGIKFTGVYSINVTMKKARLQISIIILSEFKQNN